MSTPNLTEAQLIADAELTEQAFESESNPQDGYKSGPVTVFVQKTGPAFAPPTIAQALTHAGDVLNAIDRKVVVDLVYAWDRLLKAAGVPVVNRLPATPVAPWPAPAVVWDRLREQVVQALCYASVGPANTDTALCAWSSKWEQADTAICAWVRHHRDALARELHQETHLTDYELSEDGAADQARLTYLRARIDDYTRFLSGGVR